MLNKKPPVIVDVPKKTKAPFIPFIAYLLMFCVTTGPSILFYHHPFLVIGIHTVLIAIMIWILSTLQ